jgi:NAD(P)-dependent dehydrogenase (short-subunit alcohol dehydrogenase family)
MTSTHVHRDIAAKSRLASLSSQSGVVVIGATGGLGSAFCDLLREDPRIVALHALSRRRVDEAEGIIIPGFVDVVNETSIEAAAKRCEAIGDIDCVIVASGLLHRGDAVQPEKRMRELDAFAMHELMMVNAIGPALIAKHFLPRLRRRGKTVFAAISARVGSIADNQLGGWASYRASKAALNMLIRTLAIEQARTHPDCVCVALHPGTVDTQLSEPFQARVPEGQLQTPADAAARLLDVIDGLGAEDTGGFFAWDGTRLPY